MAPMSIVGQGICAAFALAVLAGPCEGADIPVRYDVDAKAFKGAVSGTQLTFALFSDAMCSVPAGSELVPVDDILAESIKTIRPKGAEPSPKVARLHHVLGGLAASPQLYLTVTGTEGSPPSGEAARPRARGRRAWTVSMVRTVRLVPARTSAG